MKQDLHILCAFSDRVLRGFKPNLEEDIKLNRTEVQLIVLINHKKNKPMRFYGSRLNLEKGSFTYVVDSLENQGYVTREQSEEDKRKKTVLLTEKGQQLADEIKRQHQVYIERKLEVYTEDEVKEIEEMTKRFSELIEKLPERKHPGHPHKRRRPKGPNFEHRIGRGPNPNGLPGDLREFKGHHKRRNEKEEN